jgi:hypothetical protein
MGEREIKNMDEQNKIKSLKEEKNEKVRRKMVVICPVQWCKKDTQTTPPWGFKSIQNGAHLMEFDILTCISKYNLFLKKCWGESP